jgi:hypothetical protein
MDPRHKELLLGHRTFPIALWEHAKKELSEIFDDLEHLGDRFYSNWQGNGDELKIGKEFLVIHRIYVTAINNKIEFLQKHGKWTGEEDWINISMQNALLQLLIEQLKYATDFYKRIIEFYAYDFNVSS